MRTTLNIDDDVLIAVKEVAVRESKSTGAVVSSLLRQSLTHGGPDTSRDGAELETEFGFRPFPRRGGIVTNELIDRLRDETGD
ncbi:MAG: antitoxin [Gammaproteobacteria bacterium]|nr:antitoxin [Gammaproteobacteria bacterium]